MSRIYSSSQNTALYPSSLTRELAFLPKPSSPASKAFFMECGGLGSPYGTTYNVQNKDMLIFVAMVDLKHLVFYA
jgi:hypothetical protein